VADFDWRRQSPGSFSSDGASDGSAGALPGKRSLVESHPVHLAREALAGGRLPPLKPDANMPVSMLSHMGSADPDAEFDEALPVEVLAANALARGMLGAPRELPHRAAVEAKLGHPLKNVRCFGGQEGMEACAMVGARAFTVGNVMVFAEDAPPLETVLHEAVHYVQQGGDQVDVRAGGSLPLASPGDASEREAHRVAGDAMAGGGAQASGAQPEISRTGPQLNGFFYLSGCSSPQSNQQAAPTQVSNTISDAPYGWKSKYQVEFTATEIQLTVKIKLDPQSGVSKEDVTKVGQRASASFTSYYDNKFVFTDTGDNKQYTLRCTAQFVDSGEHEVVKLHAGGDASTGGHRVKWYVGWPDMDYAHELGHHLGLKDEYVDAAAPNRATGSSPGVHTDNSLMGNYYSEGRSKAEVKVRHAQTIAGHVGGATGRSFTVSKK
jgi:hypothetical protein